MIQKRGGKVLRDRNKDEARGGRVKQVKVI